MSLRNKVEEKKHFLFSLPLSSLSPGKFQTYLDSALLRVQVDVLQQDLEALRVEGERLHVQGSVEVAAELDAPGDHARRRVHRYVVRLQPALRHFVGISYDFFGLILCVFRGKRAGEMGGEKKMSF